ncbi:MAG TPA: acyl-CoA dehydratase activase [Anaerolineae bacterium]|nr:acyl-CoA dehydratase activase [Anaerolineae bacterium]
MPDSIALGIDIGSTTVKVVVLDAASRELRAWRYVRANGRPRQTLLDTLAEMNGCLTSSTVACVGFTGSGGGPVGELVGAGHVNELVAQTRAVSEFYPEARTVIEIGGQDSKLLILERQHGKTLLVDFAMNTLCAAGTGAFLDQQAERLGIAIEGEFAELALQSESPARIAGRCTVFAKSDMIHLQQKGAPLPDVLSGLCYALVRNFRSVIGRGKPFEPPILFQGGVAHNRAVVRAFEDVLKTSVVIPQHHTLMAAWGTALEALDAHAGNGGTPFAGFAPLEAAARDEVAPSRSQLPPLWERGRGGEGATRRGGEGGNTITQFSVLSPQSSAPTPYSLLPTPAFLGIDVGSISTNVVLMDESRQVMARRYLRTAGRPLEAVRQGLCEIGAEVGDGVVVQGVGVTGSGRYLTGYFVGADVVCNEITAQATAAVHFDPAVDTVFEIGGQDSKYIRLDRGAVVDFTMNKACAAGTGSFLEEQADRLKIDIARDFSALALAADAPAALGERCTVFMESDLIHHQQQGAAVDDLTAGLAYSVAYNYLNKVVNGRAIGQRIFFQGGVASNAGVSAAFRQLLSKDVTVPPHHDVTGAIGAAILAQEARCKKQEAGSRIQEAGCRMQDAGCRMQEASTENLASCILPPLSQFKGFDLTDRQYTVETFVCRACPNLCEVSRVTVAGEPPMYTGARCERFEEAGRDRNRAADVPDYVGERLALWLGDYDEARASQAAVKVGLLRTLTTYDLFPYWRALFAELGVGLVLSDVTNPYIVSVTAETATAETCFPVKAVMGHVHNLLDKGVDFVFMPGIMTRETIAPGQTHNTLCPFIQASPWIAAAAVDIAARGARPLHFPLHLLWEDTLLKEFRPLTDALGVSARRMRQAIGAAQEAQRAFAAAVRARGAAAMAALGDKPAVVLVGRAYNVYDPGLNQDLPYKIRKLGVTPLPLDYLPLAATDVSDHFEDMYWRSGQDILAAARLIRQSPNLHALYITNFACGPDSFILSFFRRELGAQPFLELEFDDHTADAGVITRCEAFFDSLRL